MKWREREENYGDNLLLQLLHGVIIFILSTNDQKGLKRLLLETLFAPRGLRNSSREVQITITRLFNNVFWHFVF